MFNNAFKAKRSVLRRILAISIPLALLWVMAILALFEWRNLQLAEATMEADISNITQGYAAVLSSPVWNLDEDQVQRLLDSMLHKPELAWASVVLDDGDILVQVGDINAEGNIATGEHAITHTFDSGSQKILGYLSIGLTDYVFSQQRERRLLYDGFLLVGLAVALALSLMVAYRSIIGLPLARLMVSIKQGHQPFELNAAQVNEPVMWQHEDELGELVDAYNQLQCQQQETQLSLRHHRDNLADQIKTRTQQYKTAKDEAEEANAAKSRFLATVSHELRTPLTSIKGSLGLIRGGVFDKNPEKLPPIINLAYTNAERLHHLVDDILDIERLNVGKMNFEMNSVNVSSLLEEAALSTESYGSQYGVTFVCAGTDEPLLVNGDHHRLIQVMSNLLSNAAKFSHRDGQVDLSVRRHDGHIRISVQDYGCGIPESARATIFDDFTQVDSSDQRATGGSGLGLGIAKKIVEAHDGHISFISEVDKGSTFYVDLPELITSEA